MLRVSAILALLFSFVAPSLGQEAWPQRQVTFVVPFGAGGTTDVVARILAQHMQAKFGQPFVIENRGGAGGSTGTLYAARLPPDGYSVLIGSLSSHVINQLIYKKLTLDTEQSFQPVSLIVRLPNLLAVNPKVPVTNVAELIAHAKAHPDTLTFGSSGVGTSSHLSGELLKLKTGTRMTHVPYKSASESTNALVGGHIDLAFDNMSLLWPMARDGAIRGLAVSSHERNPAAPEIPSIAETFPGFEVTAWFAMFVPMGTPRAVVDALAAEVKRIVELPEVRKTLLDTGALPSPMDPDSFAEFIKKERNVWRETVSAAKVSID